MIYCNLLKFSFIWNFRNKEVSSIGTLKYEWVIKTREIFNFLPPINNSETIEFNFYY